MLHTVKWYTVVSHTWIGISIKIMAKKLGSTEYQRLKYSLLSICISRGTETNKKTHL